MAHLLIEKISENYLVNFFPKNIEYYAYKVF